MDCEQDAMQVARPCVCVVTTCRQESGGRRTISSTPRRVGTWGGQETGQLRVRITSRDPNKRWMHELASLPGKGGRERRTGQLYCLRSVTDAYIKSCRCQRKPTRSTPLQATVFASHSAHPHRCRRCGGDALPFALPNEGADIPARTRTHGGRARAGRRPKAGGVVCRCRGRRDQL